MQGEKLCKVQGGKVQGQGGLALARTAVHKLRVPGTCTVRTGRNNNN